MVDSIFSRLSKRQEECLALVARGYTSKQIARKLDISPSTVDNHINTVVNLIGAQSRADAARKFMAEITRQKMPRQPETIAITNNPEQYQPAPLIFSWRNFLTLPPIGGVSVDLNWKNKTFHIAQIAVIYSLLLLSIILTMTGAISLLS